jgi:predicted NBD/HSP70 family sugar kinase
VRYALGVKRFAFTRKQIASNKTPRQINRNLIFNLIRMRQPISRADLARVSGLQRSTVSLIAEELIQGKWVLEGQTGKLPRGRRPTFLQLNDQRAVIALDIHPSQTTVAVVDLGGRVVAQSLVVLPSDPGKALKSIIAAIKNIMTANKDKSFDGIGISLPGRADPGHEKLVFAPNLRWPALSIKTQIERGTGLRVEMDNVANACALSEVWFGDSDGLHDLVVVNVAEGIGTGIFANGQLLRGDGGMAGEFGHVQLDPEGPECACGYRGCWEMMASNRAGLRYYSEGAPNRGVPTFEALLRLAQAGDPEALKAVRKMASNLGRGMRMIAAALAPAEIVVVGDITTAWHLVGPVVEEEIRRSALARPPVRPAYEGNAARLRSAVALVMNEEEAGG